MLRLYRSTFLRVFLVLFILLMGLAWGLVHQYAPYYIDKTLKKTYLESTGHELHIAPIVFDPYNFTLSLNQIKDSKNLWQAEQIFLSVNAKESIKQRNAIIDEIVIHKLKARVLQNEMGAWNFNDVLTQLSKQSQKTTKASDSAIPLLIKNVRITQASIDVNVQVLKAVTLAIAPVNLSFKNIDLRNKSAFNLDGSAEINKDVRLLLKGHFNPTKISGEFDVKLSQIPFVWFDPLLKSYAAVEILQGSINTQNHFSVREGQLKNIVTSGQLLNLKVRPTNIEQDAIKWNNLEWRNAELSLNTKTIRIPELLLNELDSQFIVGKDRKTNFQAMLIKTSDDAAQSVASDAQQLADTWKFWVERLSIKDAALGFYDESLTPHFTAIVQKFSGDITDISNDPDKTSRINLNGNVDGYAPVSLKGDAKLFINKPQLNTLISFQKMDMGAFSPYSAEYAGWRINKGLLSVDLNYQYENGKIVGKNHVVLEHLEFGEKVRGTHLNDIPLRLGLSLLTDEHGVAVLDTEVSGSPTDPAFSFKDIIARAIRNSLKKILTSPFRAIANLLKTKEDLGRVQFTAGEYQLTNEAKAKLTLLQQAIQKRPKMRLTLLGTYDRSADVLALQEEQVTSEMQKKGVTLESIKRRTQDWVKAVNSQYQISALPNIDAPVENKYQELIAQQIVTDERLHNLSHARAQAVKQHFVLTLGIASELLLLVSDTSCDNKNQCKSSEVIFTLEE